jgi:GT2 family glycosyltransferase
MSPLVAIVVLNWNNAPDTLECLNSVAKLDYDNFQVTVVDNGSTDGSAEIIYRSYPSVEIVELESNLGYAEGNNVGIRHVLRTEAKYLLILNNDVRVAPDTLDHLVSAAEQVSDVAFFGPKIYHLDVPDHIQSAGGELDYLWQSRQRGLDTRDVGQFDMMEDVDYVIGAAVLGRLDLVNKIGLLDPDFFLYREDIDWCLRARRSGYRVVYVPQAKVWHRSHHVREKELPRVTYYMTRNSLMLLKKQGGGVTRFTLVVLRFLLIAAAWTIKPKWRHKRAERDALLKGIVDFTRNKTGWGYE